MPARMVAGRVEGLDDAVAVHGSHGSTVCALRGDGRVLCWGGNEVGQIGDGTTVFRPHPTLVPELTDVVAINAS